VCVDASARSVARCRSVKRAYQSAVENAFSRVLLVVLDNGKVFVDVNNAVPQSHITAASDHDSHSQVLLVLNSRLLSTASDNPHIQQSWHFMQCVSLQCFDTVGWASGRA